MGLWAPPPYVVGKGGGSPYPDPIDVGTGGAQPRGIESTLRFNGLLLNDRSRQDTYIVTQIDGLSDADVRDSRDVNPGRHGETYFNAYYGGRTIVITGKVRAHTIQKLRDMQEALRQAFSDISREYPLLIGAENPERAVSIDCKKSQPIAMTETQTDLTFRRDFQVTLRASNPRFLSYTQEWLTWAPSAALNPGQTVGILAVNNLGNFSAEPIVRIDGPVYADVEGGPALRLTAYVDRNGVITSQSFTINAKPGSKLAVASGSYLELDSAQRTLVEVGTDRRANPVNAFSQLDISSDWSEFPPGESTIELTSFGESYPSVIVRYKHTYL